MTTILYSKWFQPELIAWTGALLLLGLFPPTESSISFCPLDYFGWWCPGDGLGNSISQALHLDFRNAFNTHPLGIPVMGFLFIRSIQLSIRLFQHKIDPYANPKIST